MVDNPADNVAAVIGLGEAGSEIARGLAEAGWQVRGFDPRPLTPMAEIEFAENAIDAVRGARIVFSITSAAAARSAVLSVVQFLAPGVIYADLNTSSASLKRELAEMIEISGASFVDVAVMSPVPGRGLSLPLVVSGSGARDFANLIGPLGADVEVLSGDAGAASARKLIRSVFMKGLAASLIEAQAAARAADCEDWFLATSGKTLAGADEAFVPRMLKGSRVHAIRRLDELDACIELLESLGVSTQMSKAARATLQTANTP